MLAFFVPHRKSWHRFAGGRVEVEIGIPSEALKGLQARGHQTAPTGRPNEWVRQDAFFYKCHGKLRLFEDSNHLTVGHG